MKFYFLLFCLVFVSCSEQATFPKYYEDLSKWRSDSATWDPALFQSDLMYSKTIHMPVMEAGVYGTPRYELNEVPKFEGLETTYEELPTDTGIWVSNHFFSKEGDERNEFFSISFLLHQVDTVAFSHNQRVVISRNFPDYLAQGYFQEGERKVEYLAIKTFDGDFYAIVNSRIFRGSKLRGRFVGNRLEVLEE